MAITTVERNQLVGLFVAMFNAAPGADHLERMVSSNSSPLDLAAAAEQLATGEETKALFNTVYPSFLTAEEFADRVISNLLTSDTPSGAKAWATDWIISKVQSGESFASVLKEAAWNLAVTPNENYASAQDQLLNKVNVANYFSVAQEQPSGDLASLQDVIDGVTADPASVTQAKAEIDGNLAGDTFTLTTGADEFTGGTGADTFIAQSIDAVISSFDKLDGGRGNDTLNIFSSTAKPNNFVGTSNVSISNIETININNDGGANFGNVDASKFVGATAINQVGEAAGDVSNLLSATTAGFNGTLGGNLSVTAAADATSATVALTNVSDNVADLTVKGADLDSVTVTGTLVDTDDDDLDALSLKVTASATATTLTVNTAVDTALTVTGAKVATVDASGSTGAITLVGATTVANVSTGEGKDEVQLKTTLSDDVTSATLSTGAGNDKLDVTGVTVAGGTKADVSVTVDAGEGDDTISVGAAAVALSVTGGAGNDVITLAAIDSVTEDDLVDGGEGTDTLSVAAKALVAEDYILLEEVLVGFEGIEFTGAAAASIDASRMSAYKDITFNNTAASTITKVAADQHLTTSVALTATAAGHVVGNPAATPAVASTYAGTLNITATATAAVTANAETVNLVVEADDNDDGNADTATVTLTGDAKTANVTLTSAADDAGTADDASDDEVDVAGLVLTTAQTATGNDSLSSLTISGTGTAVIINSANTALVSVDASALTNADAAGDSVLALTYTTSNTKAETIKLSGGLDDVTINAGASTYGKGAGFDTIHNLTLDVTLSDELTVVGAAGVFKAAEVSGSSFNLAMTNAAASADDSIVFHFGGNTYVYGDLGTAGTLDDADILVKIVGEVDVDLLVDVLNP